MDGKREQLLFVSAALLAGVMSWLDLRERYESSSLPKAQPSEKLELRLPPAIALGPAPGSPARTREESVFAPPRELLPLDPLILPDPPLPPISVRRPAEHPALQGVAGRAYRMPAEALGQLVLADPVGAAELDEPGDGASHANSGAAPAATPNGASNATPGAPGSTPNPGGASGSASKPNAAAAGTLDREEPLEKRHDWVATIDGRPRVYGTILNEDPVGLASRPGEDLRFQQVSAKTGGPLGAPLVYPRAEVLDFGLAQTFDNAYLLRSRALPSGPGGAASRRTLALEMLAVAPTEPRALDFALAEATLVQQALATDPGAARLLATVHAQRFDVEGELTVYRKALAAGIADPPLVAGYAALVRKLGLPERARQLVEQGRTLGRQSAELPLVEAQLLSDEGRFAEALAVLQAAENLPFLGPLEEEQKRDRTLALGQAYFAVGQLDAALREANRLLVEHPDHAPALLLLGAVQSAKADLAGAASTFGAAMAADPGLAGAMADAGIVAWRQRDGALAQRLLSQAREADPLRAVWPTLALGFVYEDAGELETARDLYDQALQLEPGEPEALYRLGRNQLRDGDPQSAAVTLRTALRLAGPETLMLVELGRASLERGRHDEALRYMREAERMEPDNAEVQWYLGLASLSAGDTLSARVPFEQAVAGGKPGAHVGLGVTAYRRGDADGALTHFDEVAKAFADRPTDPQAVYAATQVARIRDNLSKRQWLDRFGRSSLQRGWTEHMWDGSPRVEPDPAGERIQGKLEKPRDDERPGITRKVDGKGFFEVQAEVAAGAAASDTRVGLSLTYVQLKGTQGALPRARLEIFVDTDGQLRVSALDNFDTVVLAAQPLAGIVVPKGQSVLLGIERLDDVTGRFAFTVDGHRTGEPVELKTLRSFHNAFDVAVWAEAPPGRMVDALISLVRIVQAP